MTLPTPHPQLLSDQRPSSGAGRGKSTGRLSLGPCTLATQVHGTPRVSEDPGFQRGEVAWTS